MTRHGFRVGMRVQAVERDMDGRITRRHGHGTVVRVLRLQSRGWALADLVVEWDGPWKARSSVPARNVDLEKIPRNTP